MEIRLIHTGYFYADGGAMFGSIPKTAWQRRYPCDEQNGCLLAMRSVLVATDDGRVILIDTGVGDKQLKQLRYYRFFELKDLGEELQRLGYHREQVTDVVFTHLHFDHCGYATRRSEATAEIVPAFPQATHWVSREQWDNFCHPNALEKGAYFAENMLAVQEAGLLRLLDADTLLCPGVHLGLYHGHTPGQLVPFIQSSDRTFVFAGDVIPLVASLSPEWISAYDTCPVVSYSEKIRLLDEVVSQKMAVIYCHDAYTPCSTVKQVNGYYKQDEGVFGR